MNTITHQGNEFHILYQEGKYIINTLAYREHESKLWLEILETADFVESGIKKENIVRIGIDQIKTMLSHLEYMKEIETKEGQEEINYERVSGL